MGKAKRKPNKWLALLFLILIPIQLILDCIVIPLGVKLDTGMVSTDPNQLGHPAPVFTAFFFLIMLGMTIVVVILAIVLTVVLFVVTANRAKKYESQQAANANQSFVQNPSQQNQTWAGNYGGAQNP